MLATALQASSLAPSNSCRVPIVRDELPELVAASSLTGTGLRARDNSVCIYIFWPASSISEKHNLMDGRLLTHTHTEWRTSHPMFNMLLPASSDFCTTCARAEQGCPNHLGDKGSQTLLRAASRVALLKTSIIKGLNCCVIFILQYHFQM